MSAAAMSATGSPSGSWAAVAAMPESVRRYLARRSYPLKLWISPGARQAAETVLRVRLNQAEIAYVPQDGSAAALSGPAVMLVAAEDLEGPARAPLLELAQRALPGRPIVYGGCDNRTTLMDAINVWHAFRLVPTNLPAELLADAIRKAHAELALEAGVVQCADELRAEVCRLTQALQELQATQEVLLHGERLAAIGQMTGMLMQRVQEHFRSMEAFAAAIEPLRDHQQVREVLEHAIEGTRAIGALLNDLLALAQSRDAEVKLAPEPLDVLVARSVAIFSRDAIARRHEVELRCASEAVVEVDRFRLYHVLLNLLRNAAQASQPGRPIRVSTHRDGDYALIEIADEGCGMGPEQLASLFKPFSTTKGKEGLGLGLRTSKLALQRQNATLDCRSELGLGTTFTIRLPLSAQSAGRGE